MIRTIEQRLYLVGLLPLAVLAVALVVFNGFARLEDAHRQLINQRDMTAALLRAAALDALVIGNVLAFQDAARAVRKTSPSILCVTLTDVRHQIVTQVGTCEKAQSHLHRFVITAPEEGLSDFDERGSAAPPVLGELGIWVHDETIIRQRQQVILQLIASLLLIGLVVTWTGRVLRKRLIGPIQRIGASMQALARRDYSVRVETEGDDELTRLAHAINETIATIAEYTRELERRRADADQALQDADAAYLARDGLVRLLSQDLAEPMQRMHAELTAIAMANSEPALREPIRYVMSLLQTAQSDFEDLLEIATHAVSTRVAPWVSLADLWADMDRDFRRLSAAEQIPVNFATTLMGSAGTTEKLPAGTLLNLDGVRIRKVLLYLVHAMSRRSTVHGVQVHAELIRLSTDTLHVSMHLTAFYDTDSNPAALPQPMRQNDSSGSLQASVGLTDRESKVVDYLLRVTRVTSTVSATDTGTVNVLLDVSCRYSSEQAGTLPVQPMWPSPTRVVLATIVSADSSLLRFTERGEMANVDLNLMTFSQALAEITKLRNQDILLLDIADDIAQALQLIDQARAEGLPLPPIVAICPSGRISDSLANRLFEIGFAGVVQRPLQYSRLLEVIRSTLVSPLSGIGAGYNATNRPDRTRE